MRNKISVSSEPRPVKQKNSEVMSDIQSGLFDCKSCSFRESMRRGVRFKILSIFSKKWQVYRTSTCFSYYYLTPFFWAMWVRKWTGFNSFLNQFLMVCSIVSMITNNSTVELFSILTEGWLLTWHPPSCSVRTCSLSSSKWNMILFVPRSRLFGMNTMPLFHFFDTEFLP